MTDLEYLEVELNAQLCFKAFKTKTDVFVVDRVAVFELKGVVQLILFCKEFKRREFEFDSFASHVTLL